MPGNCGQIVKKYLLQKEASGFKFTYKGKNEKGPDRVRRSLKRVRPHVSVPTDMPAKKVKQLLNEKIRSGDIDIGVSIVQREYQKLSVEKSGGVTTKTFTVDGRKHPLSKLRQKLFNKHEKFMRLNTNSYFEDIQDDELVNRLSLLGEYNHNEDFNYMKQKLKMYERSRNFQVWHDGSSIANHEHILFCINVLYDPAVFYTSKEYKEITGIDINVQREVETPKVYIIGRCKNNDEQLGYITTRVECLKELAIGLDLNEINEKYGNTVLHDTMRLFHGDGPAVALEAGNQKGGYYFCPSCDVHKCLTDDISHCYQQKPRSIQEKQQKVILGKLGRSKSLRKETCPFENLSAVQMKEELLSRKIDLKKLKTTKKDLLPELKRELRGVKRVPILLLNDPLIELGELGLSKYEISMVECMHDIGNHIDNLLEELPHHLIKEADKLLIKNMITAYNSEKEQKRCCDRRFYYK